MPLSKFVFKPGIFREGTAYDNEGGWFDSNLVRFNAGRPEKVGGWRKDTENSFLGTCRALHSWVSLDGSKFLGLGTHLKYYVLEGDTFNDVTPIRATTTNGIVFSATNNSSTITATDSNHGAVSGDFVTLSGAATLGGLITAAVLNQEYQILAVPSVNTFTFTAIDASGNTVVANSSDSGNGGAGVDGSFQINVGLDVYIQSTGYGSGAWNENTWGSVNALSKTNQLRNWSHDHFGEDLIIAVRNGEIFYWDKTDGVQNRAVALTGINGASFVPTICLGVTVSETDRHVIVLGADPIVGNARSGVLDPMLIAFSDQEDPLQFEPLDTNTAGDLRLSEGSLIVGSVKARQETLVWTDTALYSVSFIGPPFTFGLNLINNNTGLISPNGAITSPSGVYWMGYDNFYVYTGSVQKVPCSVLSYVFDDLNGGQAYKICSFTNNAHDEVGWFYPSANSIEVDRYVVFDYNDNVWSYGELSRTAWLDEGTVDYPRAVSENYLYEHEFGYNDDGSPMTNVFIESSDFDIGDGEQFSFLNKIIPDIKFLSNSNEGKVNMVLKTRNFPGDTLTTNSTNSIASTTQQAHIRGRARQAVLRLESEDNNTNGSNDDTGWRLGATRINIRSDGRR
tara:strand:- start:5503 stop:7368 length:1866 start_codon:yes stop_codon:yes gene_type:complete